MKKEIIKTEGNKIVIGEAKDEKEVKREHKLKKMLKAINEIEKRLGLPITEFDKDE
jgi:hypothetical protein